MRDGWDKKHPGPLTHDTNTLTRVTYSYSECQFRLVSGKLTKRYVGMSYV